MSSLTPLHQERIPFSHFPKTEIVVILSVNRSCVYDSRQDLFVEATVQMLQVRCQVSIVKVRECLLEDRVRGKYRTTNDYSIVTGERLTLKLLVHLGEF